MQLSGEVDRLNGLLERYTKDSSIKGGENDQLRAQN